VFGAGTTASPTLSLALAVFVTAAIIMPAALGLRIRRALERAVAEAIRARAEHVATLQAHNAELMDLSRTVAHELKNPLASIQGLAGLLARRQVAGSREAERAGVLIDETRRLAGLLDEFLNFGRPAQGLAVRPVEARELFAAIADIFEATLRPLELRLEIDLQTIVPLRCDPRKLQQVLFNLIDNAVSVSPRGGHIVLRVEDMKPDSDDKHDSHIGHIGHMITVLDEGPGLPPAVRERLFQVGTTTRAGGSGLGLAIARQIARQHGGDLHVDDRPEGGCIARVHLPRMIPSADDRAGAET
jgi:two-component system sensor histidine kinase HydH